MFRIPTKRRSPWLIAAAFVGVSVAVGSQAGAAFADSGQAYSVGPIEIKTPVADVTVPEITIAHGCKVSSSGVCVVPGPSVGASTMVPADNYYNCNGTPDAQHCDGVDPVQSGCNSNATTVSDGYRYSQYAKLVVAERWSQDCQSNWPSAGTDAPCYYGNNSQNCDNWTVCEGYGGGCDSRAYYANNGMIGAYGQMLYGGQGMQCIWASATHYFSSGTTDNESWSADKCV